LSRPTAEDRVWIGSHNRKQKSFGRNILLCEDNALNREISTALLKDKGVTVDTAENGREGVQKFMDSAPGTYDAVLMDIRMPVMNGIEAAKQIRLSDRPDAKSVPIIAMTADTFSDDIQKCLDAGMNGHLAKPVDPESFMRRWAPTFNLNEKTGRGKSNAFRGRFIIRMPQGKPRRHGSVLSERTSSIATSMW
jgi:CheY-like chemotaxis protein